MNKRTESNPNGNNEVHASDCRHYNQLTDYVSLGYHSNCASAVAKAKRMGYPNADGCKVCSLLCHTA